MARPKNRKHIKAQVRAASNAQNIGNCIPGSKSFCRRKKKKKKKSLNSGQHAPGG